MVLSFYHFDCIVYSCSVAVSEGVDTYASCWHEFFGFKFIEEG